MPVFLTPHARVQGRRNSSAQFYLGDCLDLFAALPARSVDVIVTSPPYNLGIRYNQYRDTDRKSTRLNSSHT